MKKAAYLINFLALITIIGSGCKSLKRDRQNAEILVVEASALKVEDRLKAETQFDEVSINGSIKYTTDNALNLGITLKMKNDSIIWGTVRAIAGIEAARLLITKDTVLIISRLERTYISMSFDSLQKFTGKKLELIALQNLLLGNLKGIVSDNTPFSKSEMLYKSKTLEDSVLLFTTLNYLLKPIELIIKDMRAKNSQFIVSYDYLPESNTYPITPQNIRVNSNNKKLGELELHFKSINFDSGNSFPFRIPENFKKIEL